MLIGNTWVKGARLRILNAFVSVPAATTWIMMPQTLVLNNEERAFIVGLTQVQSGAAGALLNSQITYDGTACHEGWFRSAKDQGAQGAFIGNQQPTTVIMPRLDVPPDTEIGLRVRHEIGGISNQYLDLFVVSYYMRDQDRAAPVCFPPSAWPLPCP